MYQHKVLTSLKKILATDFKGRKSIYKNKLTTIKADFKTARKKFLDNGIPIHNIDKIFERFKKLRDTHRILKNDEKNIDYWANKNFKYLSTFVEELERTPSKSKSKKTLRNAPWRMETPSGATKVAENNSWVVYKIEDYEASEKLGTRNWCISRSKDHYDSETAGMVFYFLLSKKADYGEEDREEKSGFIYYTNAWHRIALQVSYDGTKTFWDAEDNAHSNIPAKVVADIPEFIIEKPDVEFSVFTEYNGTDKLDAKTLDDAIEEAKEFVENFVQEGSKNRSQSENYRIYLGDKEVYDDTVSIEGAWDKLRKELGDEGEVVCSDTARNSRACIMKKNDTYYFLTSDFSDSFCEEIDENTLFLYRLLWGDLDSIEWILDNHTSYETDDSILSHGTDFYRVEFDRSLYFHFYDQLDKENETADKIRRFIKKINEDTALTLLYEKGQIENAAYYPDNNEMVLELSENGGYYKCEYRGEPEKYPKIEFIDRITRTQFEEISSQEGWIKV